VLCRVGLKTGRANFDTFLDITSLLLFPNKLYIKIKLIVQDFQIYNHLLSEIIIKRIISHQRREH
jgi:hypothetical protein